MDSGAICPCGCCGRVDSDSHPNSGGLGHDLYHAELLRAWLSSLRAGRIYGHMLTTRWPASSRVERGFPGTWHANVSATTRQSCCLRWTIVRNLLGGKQEQL
ncbi:MAG: hypothetical protein QXY49_06250 [Thermofilaceae archaeon]